MESYYTDNNLDRNHRGTVASEVDTLSVDSYCHDEKGANPIYTNSPNNDLINIIGESEAIKKTRFLISTHGRYDAPVLVTGETGTGKELAARGLHYCGSRSSKPFVAINCATLTDDLFASEIFGHVKGSFTDAKKDKKGLLALAEKGTLFLDEIDSLSLKSQAALLRFLQENEYRPVGSEVSYRCNVRLIASANCDLEKRIQEGSFRADLYYRLYILSIHMPSLRERVSDIPLLTTHFITQFDYRYGLGIKEISPSLFKTLMSQKWPGNIRELENLIHRLYLCNSGNVINGDMLDYSSSSFPGSAELTEGDVFNNISSTSIDEYQCYDFDNEDYNFSRDKKLAVDNFEHNYVNQLMEKTSGNVTLAAKLCGKERRAFGKLVKKYNVKKDATVLEEDTDI